MVAAALTASLFALSEHAKYFRKEADTVDQISVACSGITFFYGWWNPAYLFLIIATIRIVASMVINWLLNRFLNLWWKRAGSRQHRKLFLESVRGRRKTSVSFRKPLAPTNYTLSPKQDAGHLVSKMHSASSFSGTSSSQAGLRKFLLMPRASLPICMPSTMR